MQENEKVADIWKRTKNQCEVSDVLVLNKNGEISCYYVDENYPQYLACLLYTSDPRKTAEYFPISVVLCDEFRGRRRTSFLWNNNYSI